MALLELNGVTKRFGGLTAVDSVTFSVEAGEIFGLIGPNGAGKTTLLAAVMGALPANGTARGVVRFGGVVEPQASVESMVARGMTLVPEKRELFGEMTVEDNLLLGAFQRYRSGKRDHGATMAEVYALFPRLQERRTQLAGTLSGGERQMLAVGRALMAKPRLLMLDEPSLGLAPRIVREIFHIIVELKRRGVSILLVEQNARAAVQIADYAYVLETGEVVLDGPAGALANDPRVIESYLGLGQKH
jgi:branched-chain amino acid transport system ATP-binding protein